jgi:hypothetical protein
MPTELTFDRAGRGQVLLDSAGTRLDEAQRLSSDADRRGQRSLDAFTQQAIDGPTCCSPLSGDWRYR